MGEPRGMNVGARSPLVVLTARGCMPTPGGVGRERSGPGAGPGPPDTDDVSKGSRLVEKLLCFILLPHPPVKPEARPLAENDRGSG